MNFNVLVEELYRSVQSRRRPEDVAAICEQLLANELPKQGRRVLSRVSAGALQGGAQGGYTSMSQDFQRPQGLAAQLPTAYRLFPDVPSITDAEAAHPEMVTAYLIRLNAAIGKRVGIRDFKHG